MLKSKKKKADERQLELSFPGFKPGWTGWRYLLCTDGTWHLVTAILDEMVADTLCCSDTAVQTPLPSNGHHPMCQECSKLHFSQG